jgi:hypothetical protein
MLLPKRLVGGYFAAALVKNARLTAGMGPLV